MKPGVVIWLLGGRESLERWSGVLRSALERIFPVVVVLSEDEAKAVLGSAEGAGDGSFAPVVKKLGWICRRMTESGGVVVILSTSSKREERDAVRRMCPATIEAMLSEGETPDLEPPFYPEMEIATDSKPEEISSRLLETLKAVGIVVEKCGKYDAKEEQIVKERLEKLGYL